MAALRESIKSRERVRQLGEVYTQPREVQAMLDLLPAEIHQDLHARWLEPACGDGNFLVAILERKLQHVRSDRDVVAAVTSIYGVDIDAENVVESRERMLATVLELGIDSESDVARSVQHVLHTTIVCGNTLIPDDRDRIVGEWSVESDGGLWVRMVTVHEALHGVQDGLFSDVPDWRPVAWDQTHVECPDC